MDIKELFRSHSVNQVIFDLRGGWKLRLWLNAEGSWEMEHFNPVSETDKRRKFFIYSTVGNPYGAGKIIQEPDLALVAPKINLPVVGALVLDQDGNIAERYSWSNLFFMKKIAADIDENNQLYLIDENGQPIFKGKLRALFLPDKNRMEGYVGIFDSVVERAEGPVRVLEMESLLLNSL